MRKIVDEFKEFINRGNVVDMAVGLVVGAAFTAIVNSLVKDIFNPLIGLLTGGVDFGKLKITLKEATETSEALTINYGNFINAVINFLIVAIVVFLIVKTLNEAHRLQEKKAKKSEDTTTAEEPPASAAKQE